MGNDRDNSTIRTSDGRPGAAHLDADGRARPVAPVLVPTKLAIPPLRPRIVARPRLLDRFAEVDYVPLTLVTAPAGFGKTTLVAAWAASYAHPLAWVTLDDGDNDPARFWRYIAAAIDSVREGAAAGLLDLLHAPQPPADAPLLAALVDACTLLQPGTVLVLDDYHLITERSIHEDLGALVSRLPATAHLALATRADPPLPLARLRARAQLLEIRAADLRFTAAETADFLCAVMDLDLSADDVAALELRTEGWAVGLQLAALAMRGHADPAAFVAAFAGNHRFVLDYLAEEVIQTQPEPVRRFLVQTGLLDRLNADLCDAVTAGRNGQEMLEYAERANLFVLPLDDEGQWYRYHHLFAEVLRGLLRREDPDLVPALHRRAADWYAAHDLPEEAIHYALAAGAVDRAAELIEQAGWTTVWHEGEVATLRAWIQSLPAEVVRRHPGLCLLHAWALVLLGPHAEIEAWLQAAEAALPREASQRTVLQGRIAAARALLSGLHGAVGPALEFARQALEDLPASDVTNRAVATYARGLALWFDGAVGPAREALTAAAALYRAAGTAYTELIALAVAAHQLALAGQLQAAEAAFDAAIVRGTAPGGRVRPATCYPAVFRADLLREWDQLDEALRQVEEGIALAERTGNADALCNGYVFLAAIQQARGDLDAAEAATERAAALVAVLGLAHASGEVAARRGRLLLARGDQAAANRWAQEQQEVAGGLVTIAQEVVDLARARVALAAGRPDTALALLEPLRSAAEAAGRGARAVEALALQALAHQAHGDTETALDTLRRALTWSEREGFVSAFAGEGAPMAALLRALLGAPRHGRAAASVSPVGPSAAYVARLIAACTPSGPVRAALTTPTSVGHGHATGPISPLTAREREVLALIAEGLTNAQIAARLVVELSTVKRHVNNIYTKLGAENRTGAVARARALRLLDV